MSSGERELKCELCESASISVCARANRFFQITSAAPVYQCLDCGFLFRTTLPDSDSSESRDRATPLFFGEYTAGDEQLNSRMQKRLERLSEWIPQGHRTLLDVGCGSGTFLAAARAAGWEAWGTETAEPVPYPQELAERVFPVDLTCAPLPKGEIQTFSVIHINHVLEHVPSPTALLRAVIPYLSSGGFLVLEVPNEWESLASRLKRLFAIPYNGATAYFQHYSFFGPHQLMQLLHGFDLHIVYLATPSILDRRYSLCHRLFDRLQSRLQMGAVSEAVAQFRN